MKHTLSYTSGSSDTPLLGITIGDLFDQTVARYGNNEALIVRHQGIRYTYGQLKAQVDRCARALMALGAEKGDHRDSRTSPKHRKLPPGLGGMDNAQRSDGITRVTLARL